MGNNEDEAISKDNQLDEENETAAEEDNTSAENQLYELRKAGRLSQVEQRIPLTGWQKIKWGRDSR